MPLLLRSMQSLLLPANLVTEDGPPLDAGPGAVVAASDGGLLLACANGTRLRMLRVQPEGGKPLAIADAVNGRRIAAGDHLDEPTAG